MASLGNIIRFYDDKHQAEHSLAVIAERGSIVIFKLKHLMAYFSVRRVPLYAAV